MTAIVDVHARQILDSRGNPTVEVDVTLEDGSMGRAAVPSGASTGAHEAVELRDGDKSRWGGKGVSKAVAGGQRRDRRGGRRPRGRGPGRDRRGDDRRSTAPRTRAGSAPMRSSASAWRRRRRRRTRVGLPLYRYVGGVDANLLPVPMMNILNGGVHADNPHRLPGIHGDAGRRADFRRGAALRGGDLPCAEERRCTRPGLSTAVGDEGGFAPAINSAREALDFIDKAVERRRLQARRRRAARARLRGERVLQGRRLRDERRGQEPDAGGNGRLSGRAGRRLSDRLDRGRHGRGRLEAGRR